MKTKHIAAMAAAIAVCSGTALYMPQDTFVSGVLTASAAETVNSNSRMEVYAEDENAFVFHVNDPVDFENKEFYEQNYGKFDDVSLLVYDDNDGEIDFKYRLRNDYERFSFDMSEVNMKKAGTYPVYVTDKKDASIRTSFNITVNAAEESTTTTTTTTDNSNSTTTTTTTTAVTTENETPETTTTVTTLPQTGYSSLYNYMMLLAAAITTLGGYVMAKARKKLNNN